MTPVQDSTVRSQGGGHGSFRIATVAGIPIRVHFTFFLLLLWIGYIGEQMSSLAWPVLVLTIFACVILHELGHALTGLHFGIRTRDITLYPIGGLAVLQDRPKPKQELWIALAGPAVNVVIAALLFGALALTSPVAVTNQRLWNGQNFLANVIMANVILAVFNMIPAFPMDGGRVLRAAMAMAMPEARATQIAGAIGQTLAIGLIAVGLLRPDILVAFIGFFVFLGAGQEVRATVARSFLDGKTLKDAMATQFRTVEHGALMDQAAQMLLEGSQHDFPVVAGDEVLGVLTKFDIARGLSAGAAGSYVSEYMNRATKKAPQDMPLESAMELFAQSDSSPILVMHEEELIGMVTSENLSEFIMLQAARSQAHRG